MLQIFKNGQGSIIIRCKILNSSVSTGAGLTGLTSASSGLIISTIADNEATATTYTVAGSTIETITTLGTYAAPTATKCRFKEVDATNHKGVYEIHLADARYAVSNAKSLLVSISGATNAAETDFVIPLTSVDLYDGVRGNMTALPNAAAGANTGLPVVGTQVPNATAGASGGLFISGSNSGTTTVGALTVSGATTLTGAVSLGSTLGITGAFTATNASNDVRGILLQATQTGVTIPTVTTVGAVTTVNGLAADVITAASIASDAGVEIAAAVWDRVLTAANHNIANSAGRRLRNVDASFEVHTGTAQAGGATSITLDTGASSTNDIYKGDRVIITAGTGAGEHGIITAYNGTTKVATMSKAWPITPDNTSEFTLVPADVDIETWNNTAITGDGDWSELQTDVDAILVDTAEIGAAGAGLTAIPWNAAWDAEVQSEVADGLTAYGASTLTQAQVTGGAYALNSASFAFNSAVYNSIADQVWDEAISGHLTAGSTGNALNAAGSAGDPWSTPIPGAYGAGTAGYILGTNLDAVISTRQATFTSGTSITFPTNFGTMVISGAGVVSADAVAISGDATAANNAESFFDGTGYAGTNNVIPTVTTVTTVTNLTNAPTSGDLTATMKASVNAEVLDVLNVDTFAEIGQESPAATTTLRKMLGYLYKAWRNKTTQTSTTTSLYNDAGDTVDQKATVSDDGTTFTKGEIGTGP